MKWYMVLTLCENCQGSKMGCDEEEEEKKMEMMKKEEDEDDRGGCAVDHSKRMRWHHPKGGKAGRRSKSKSKIRRKVVRAVVSGLHRHPALLVGSVDVGPGLVLHAAVRVLVDLVEESLIAALVERRRHRAHHRVQADHVDVHRRCLLVLH